MQAMRTVAQTDGWPIFPVSNHFKKLALPAHGEYPKWIRALIDQTRVKIQPYLNRPGPQKRETTLFWTIVAAYCILAGELRPGCPWGALMLSVNVPIIEMKPSKNVSPCLELHRFYF
jgi:hypothetical protein